MSKAKLVVLVASILETVGYGMYEQELASRTNTHIDRIDEALTSPRFIRTQDGWKLA